MTDRSTMRIIYTEHAEARMDFRKILKAEVEQGISKPYFTITSRFGRTIAVKKKATSI